MARPRLSRRAGSLVREETGATAYRDPIRLPGPFVSLHRRAGASPLEVAAWAGHSTQVMFRHCAAVIEELNDGPRIPVEEQIARARDVVEDKPAEGWTTSLRGCLSGPRWALQGSLMQPSSCWGSARTLGRHASAPRLRVTAG